MTARINQENWELCKTIADHLEDIADGSYYRCPHCGEVHHIRKYEKTGHENEGGDIFYNCSTCGKESAEYLPESFHLDEYFTEQEFFDIEYRIDMNHCLRSVSLMVVCGGPNVYIDTGKKAVLSYWGSDFAEYTLTSETCTRINEHFGEIFNR